MSIAFGNVIRHWRDIRRFSQLALSAESGMSSRHISFLETGRSRPSRGSVLTLARVLDMPKPAVNEALLAAGFAPEYKSLSMEDADLAPAMSAIMTILENHTACLVGSEMCIRDSYGGYGPRTRHERDNDYP